MHASMYSRVYDDGDQMPPSRPCGRHRFHTYACRRTQKQTVDAHLGRNNFWTQDIEMTYRRINFVTEVSHTVDALHLERDDFVHEPGSLNPQMLVSQSETLVTRFRDT